MLRAAWSDPGAQFQIADAIKTACGGTPCLTAIAVVAPPPEPDPGGDCIIHTLPRAGKLVQRGSTITFLINNECDPPQTDPGDAG